MLGDPGKIIGTMWDPKLGRYVMVQAAAGIGHPGKIVGFDPETGIWYQAAAGAGALGASKLPAPCWNRPGFKACHGVGWQAAQKSCDPAFGGTAADFGGSVEQCIEERADDYAFDNCVPKFCPEQDRGFKLSTPVLLIGGALFIMFGVWIGRRVPSRAVG